jgi:hypothetical protein
MRLEVVVEAPQQARLPQRDRWEPPAAWVRWSVEQFELFVRGNRYGRFMFRKLAGVQLPADARAALMGFDELIADLCGLDLDAWSPLELVEFVRQLETRKRQLETVDHTVTAVLVDRRVANEVCMPSAAQLLARLLRLSPGEAWRRVRTAANLGPRRTLTGEVLAARFALVAAAQAQGVMSGEQAALIIHTIDELPVDIEAEHGAAVEQTLVELAAAHGPKELARFAQRIVDLLDPDGDPPPDPPEGDHRRFVQMSPRRDGAFTLTGRLSPLCAAKWQAVMDALAGPVSAESGLPDDRSARQRWHDAFDEIPGRLMESRQAGSAGGVPTTLLLTMRADQVTSGDGFAVTAHGDLIAVRNVLPLFGDAQTLCVTFDAHGGIADYGRLVRITPLGMRLALWARDGGCTFPGCDRPPAWTQTHHILGWVAEDGPTSLENLCLVCPYHHREFERHGWQVQMIRGRPYWIPPAWLDADRTPQRNTMHDLRSFDDARLRDDPGLPHDDGGSVDPRGLFAETWPLDDFGPRCDNGTARLKPLVDV